MSEAVGVTVGPVRAVDLMGLVKEHKLQIKDLRQRLERAEQLLMSGNALAAFEGTNGTGANLEAALDEAAEELAQLREGRLTLEARNAWLEKRVVYLQDHILYVGRLHSQIEGMEARVERSRAGE